MTNKAFASFYLFVLGFLWLLALPFLFIFSFKQKYNHSIKRRFFLWKNPPFESENVWFHGCSFGEIRSFKPFFEKLDFDIDLSTTTQTGFFEAKKIAKNARYLPFEIFLPFWIKKPKILVVSEAELWYMLFFIAKQKGSFTMLINARISDKSYKSYKKFTFFYKKIFKHIDSVYAQSETDAKRLKEFGAKNIKINGNIKTASIPKVSKVYQKPNKRVISIASSHEGEEEGILNSLKLEKNDMLIVAPRHPERFKKVQNLLTIYAKKHSLNLKTFTQDGFSECDILLVDTLGELINIYAISDISILCGSFYKHIGGHNPLECAYFNNIIISGKYYHNQKTLYNLVENIYESEIDDISLLLNKHLKPSSIKGKNAILPILEELKEVYETRKSV